MDEFGQNLEGIIFFFMAVMALVSLVLSIGFFYAGYRALRAGALHRALRVQNGLIGFALVLAFGMYLRDARLQDDWVQWMFYGAAGPMLLGHMLGTSLGLLHGPSAARPDSD